MAIIQIDTNFLKINNLTVSEFFYLRQLFVDSKDKIEDLITILDLVNINQLELKGYIKITSSGIVLRNKAKELFTVDENLFDRFITTFPIKTPIKKRYLSPSKLEGVAYNTLKNKWNRIFKNNKAKAEKAIKVLEAELRMRQSSPDGIEFMNAAEAWLNQANYEKYEYLLEEDFDEKNDASNYDDWI